MFRLTELNEASRTGEGSSDLVQWLDGHRERSMEGLDAVTDDVLMTKKPPTYNGGPHGSRMDGPPLSDLKNYERGTPSEELV